MKLHEVMEVNSKSMPKRKSSPTKLSSMEYKPAENGGHVMTHRMESEDGGYHEPAVHVFGKDEGKKLLAHFAEHAGIKSGDVKPDSDSAAGAAT